MGHLTANQSMRLRRPWTLGHELPVLGRVRFPPQLPLIPDRHAKGYSEELAVFFDRLFKAAGGAALCENRVILLLTWRSGADAWARCIPRGSAGVADECKGRYVSVVRPGV